MLDKILIAGCGDVGNALATRLLADECEVWGVRRRVDALANGVRPWRIDLTDPGSFDAPPAAFDYLFYTASADRRDEAHYRSVYVDGLSNLLKALRAAGCPLRRIFFTSSTAVYGQSEGEWVDESSTTEPPGFNGRVLLEAEAIVREAAETGINVRLSGIYGPGRTRLVRKVRDEEAIATGGWTNRIHVEDCAGALHHLMRLGYPEALYLGTDDEPATTAEVVTWLSAELDAPAPPDGPTERLNKRCRNTRLRDAGYRFEYPTFREGYRPIVQKFLSQPRD
ncbi:MAG: SDR family NAD(P)-dependent oxidoreductase [Deltaproteobacteria bacterium]|nr:SDR family oxidoreductase [Deltaproteobacteria bacterium]RLB48465.1 MAG: SDR family NAD(P)-dependent oxidoreductase [Deltaproteobacteria bacterium]